MIIGETYETFSSDDFTHHLFLSEGPNGKIYKMVIFTLMENGFYNLGFGDVLDGKINDKAFSNNQDLVKVMNTIGELVYEFTRRFPSRVVYVEPVDAKRSFLYHAIFKRKLEQITPVFSVEGSMDKKDWEPFDPLKKNILRS